MTRGAGAWKYETRFEHLYAWNMTPVTDQFDDRLSHHVLDQHASYQHVLSGGLYTLCGRRIVPAPMNSPVDRPCPNCVSRIGYTIER
jgi:hypothetical protein